MVQSHQAMAKDSKRDESSRRSTDNQFIKIEKFSHKQALKLLVNHLLPQ